MRWKQGGIQAIPLSCANEPARLVNTSVKHLAVAVIFAVFAGASCGYALTNIEAF